MKLSSLKRNAAAAAEGRWVDEIPGMGDLRLKVRGLTSPAAVACRRAKERKVERKDRERGGGFKPDVEQRITREVLHEAILLDWGNFTDDDEKPIAYSEDFAGQLLLNPDFDTFAGAVTWASAALDSDNADEAGEQSGNSKRQSSGK